MPKGQYTKTRRQVLALAEKRAKKRDVAESGERKLRTRQRLEAAKEPGVQAQQRVGVVEQTVKDAGLTDDGTPPGAPTGVTVSAGDHALIVKWAEPPAADQVQRTLVRLTRVDTGAQIVQTASGLIHGVTGLAVTAYDVEVAHKDRFGRQSLAWAPVPPIRATPLPSVADRITAATSVAAGELSQLLNDPGLAPLTDPEKLAEAVVRSAALAATQDPNLLRWDEAEFENYALGALAGAVNGAGITTNVVDAPAPKRWLAVARASGSAGTTARPFGTYRDRLEGQAAGTFFFSFDARNTGASPVRVLALVEQSSDGVGTAAGTNGAVVTVAPGETKQVFVKFDTTAALTSQRFGVSLADAGTSILVNRQMLQRASAAKAEPGAYRPPGLTTGVVSAQLLAAWTVAAGRAILADATIDQALIARAAIGDLQIDRATANKLQVLSADIVSLTADKIRAGTITSTIIALGSGGELRTSTGGTTINPGGISMKRGSSYNASSLARDQTISDIESGGLSTFSFYANADTVNDGPYRGMVLRADGTSGGYQGAVVLHATMATGVDPHSATSGALEVTANGTGGRVNIFQDGVVERDLRVIRNAAIDGIFTADLFTPARFQASIRVEAGLGTTVTWATAMARAPRFTYAVLGDGEPVSSHDGLVWISSNTASAIRIENRRTVAVLVNVFVQP